MQNQPTTQTNIVNSGVSTAELTTSLTTATTIVNGTIVNTQFRWQDIVTSWAESLFTWDKTEQQTPRVQTEPTNLTTSSASINNL